MKKQHSVNGKKTGQELAAFIPDHASFSARGDSLEVLEVYHQEKIAVLERMLQQLNLLDNAREIAFICKEMMKQKKELQAICLRKKFIA